VQGSLLAALLLNANLAPQAQAQRGRGLMQPPSRPSTSPLHSFASKPGFIAAPWRPRTASLAESLREIFAWLRSERKGFRQRVADEQRVEYLAALEAEEERGAKDKRR
jgi:hypothetical protein